jgi:hypothetical protein
MSIGDSARLWEMRNTLGELEQEMRGADGSEYDYLQEQYEKLEEEIGELGERIAEEEAN